MGSTMPPTRRRHRTRSLRPIALLLALVAIAVPSIFGGATYVWCEGMARAMVRPCCPETHDHPGYPALSQPCCDDRVVAAMPSTDLAHGIGGLVAPPMLVVVAMAVLLLAMRRTAPGASAPRGRAFARAGPAPPLFLVHCALRN